MSRSTSIPIAAAALLALASCLALPGMASAQTGDNVLVVINAESAASVEVGEYYATRRAIPNTNVVRISTPVAETVSRADYERSIEVPVAHWLSSHNLQDQILYIVVTKDVPLRVTGTGGRDGGQASVDSELTLVYRKLLGQSPAIAGSVNNPLFLGDAAPAAAHPVSRFASDIYLVTRLDGFTIADVRGLIDRGLNPSTSGAFVLDQKATLTDAGGDAWLNAAAERLQTADAQRPVLLERTTALASTADPVLGYYSWGSNDPANQRRRSGFTFSPGAIAGMFVSTDGRTFVEPPADWTPSRPTGGPVFRGSFQSLTGDLIRDGVTGVSGHVDEPYLDATIRPQILFPAYVAGFNLAEAFYLAMPYLGWKTVVIGDPLCRPFSGKAMARADIAKPIDPDTELPGLFSERRLAMMGSGLNPEAVKLILKKDSRLARGEPIDLESTLVAATSLEARLISAHRQLAQIYEDRGDRVSAIDRYRRILAVDADDSAALNNLAYQLAVSGSPSDALPHAERAYRLSQRSPEITDTLGWVHHLLGDDTRAAAYLEQALRGRPNDPDIVLHAATVHLALGDRRRAQRELDVAARLGSSVTERADFKALQTRLSGP